MKFATHAILLLQRFVADNVNVKENKSRKLMG